MENRNLAGRVGDVTLKTKLHPLRLKNKERKLSTISSLFSSHNGVQYYMVYGAGQNERMNATPYSYPYDAMARVTNINIMSA